MVGLGLPVPGESLESSGDFSPTLLLFASFDLVGSTKYKDQHQERWVSDFFAFFDDISQKINLDGKVDSSTSTFNVWKMLGDEVVFTISISSVSELSQAVTRLYNTLREVRKELSAGLGLKCCAWMAHIDGQTNREIPNKYLNQSEESHTTGYHRKDYIGSAMDEGFRIAHALTHDGFLTISFDIAALLVSSDSYSHSVYQVGFKQLKGIWRERWYPAFWYSERRDTDKGNLLYDAHMQSELVMKFEDVSLQPADAATIKKIRDQLSLKHLEIIENYLAKR